MGLWTRLAGADGTARSGLPVHELLSPLPVIAIALLILNDRVLKGSAMPGWLTGKLSDVTGVFVFPLAATAVIDLVGAGVKRWDYTLRRWKLAVAIAFTAIVFGGIKLIPAVGESVERLWAAVIPGAEIVADPTDCIALLALAGTWWHGRRAIAFGAFGRLAWARARHAAGRPVANVYGDAAACGADRAIVDELETATTAWLAGGPAAPVDAALGKLRR